MIDDPEIELTEEDELALDRAWASVARGEKFTDEEIEEIFDRF